MKDRDPIEKSLREIDRGETAPGTYREQRKEFLADVRPPLKRPFERLQRDQSRRDQRR